MVGALNFLSVTTRPDITFAVSSLSQFLNEPGINHWKACLKTLAYLKHTKSYGLTFNKSSTKNLLQAYSDADWTSCPQTRRSVSGFLVVWNNNLISWKSRKQPTISLSTTEAEYKSIADVTKEIMWIKTLIRNFFKISFSIPTTIFEDNQGEIELANNQSSHSTFKTKHMEIRLHFVKQEIENQNINLKYIKSEDMLADSLTKPLGKTPLLKSLKILNVCSKSEACEQGGMLE